MSKYKRAYVKRLKEMRNMPGYADAMLAWMWEALGLTANPEKRPAPDPSLPKANP